MDRETQAKKLIVDLDKLMDKLMSDVTARVTELRKQPNSPERQAELDTLKEAMLGVQRSLDKLCETTNRKYGRASEN